MMRQIQSKKIQKSQQNNNNSQRLFLAKCLVEQQLEQIQKSGSTQISLKRNSDDGSVLFRVQKTKEIAAYAIDSKLYVFAKLLQEFRGLPLDAKIVSLSSIVKTDGVMMCRKCKSWANRANVAKCPCGGYFKKRPRFHARDETTQSLDAEYLEVQMALEDSRVSRKIDSKPRQKFPTPTGIITSSMAGMSSDEEWVCSTATQVGFLTAVSVKSPTDSKLLLKEDEKYAFFKKMGVDVESIQDDELKAYVMLDAQRRAKMTVDSWNNSEIPRDTEFASQNSKRHSRRRRQQQHNTSQKTRKAHPDRSAFSSKKRKVVTCSVCNSNTPALVESKCPDCFLKKDDETGYILYRFSLKTLLLSKKKNNNGGETYARK